MTIILPGKLYDPMGARVDSGKPSGATFSGSKDEVDETTIVDVARAVRDDMAKRMQEMVGEWAQAAELNTDVSRWSFPGFRTGGPVPVPERDHPPDVQFKLHMMGMFPCQPVPSFIMCKVAGPRQRRRRRRHGKGMYWVTGTGA